MIVSTGRNWLEVLLHARMVVLGVITIAVLPDHNEADQEVDQLIR